MIYFFGIPIFKDCGYCDYVDDGVQYEVFKWSLPDMEKYNRQYATIRGDCTLKIHDKHGNELFSGSLLDSMDFRMKLKDIIADTNSQIFVPQRIVELLDKDEIDR